MHRLHNNIQEVYLLCQPLTEREHSVSWITTRYLMVNEYTVQRLTRFHYPHEVLKVINA